MQEANIEAIDTVKQELWSARHLGNNQSSVSQQVFYSAANLRFN